MDILFYIIRFYEIYKIFAIKKRKFTHREYSIHINLRCWIASYSFMKYVRCLLILG